MGFISDLWLLSLNLLFSTTVTPPVWVDQWVQRSCSLRVSVGVHVQISLHALLCNLLVPCLGLTSTPINKLPSLLANCSMILANFLKIWLPDSAPIRWRLIRRIFSLSSIVTICIWSECCVLIRTYGPYWGHGHSTCLFIAWADVNIPCWSLICWIWSNLYIQWILRAATLWWPSTSSRSLCLPNITGSAETIWNRICSPKAFFLASNSNGLCLACFTHWIVP